MLLKARANPSAPGGSLASPLHAACHTGKVEVIKSLLHAGCFPSLERSWYGVPFEPVIPAILCDQAESVAVLLNAGISTSKLYKFKTSEDKLWPLSTIAAVQSACSVLRVLATYGADMNQEDAAGKTALQRVSFLAAATQDKKHYETIKTLILLGAHAHTLESDVLEKLPFHLLAFIKLSLKRPHQSLAQQAVFNTIGSEVCREGEFVYNGRLQNVRLASKDSSGKYYQEVWRFDEARVRAGIR